MLERLSTKFPDVKFLKADYDLFMQESAHFNVSGFPTLILLKDGDEVARKVGAASEPSLKAWIQEKAGV